MKKIAMLVLVAVAVVGCAKSQPAPASHTSHASGGKLG
jgi:hypothetical protein